MSVLLAKLEKRRFYPVKVAGEDVYIRLMTDNETRHIEKLKDEFKSPYVLGTILCESETQPAFPMESSETPEAYANRMRDVLSGIPQDNVAELMAMYTKLAKIPTVDTIAKN